MIVDTLPAARAPVLLVAGAVHLWRLPWRAAREAREAALLAVLSRYAGEPVVKLRIEREAKGRPLLVGAARALHFGVSHSDELLLLAVATQACGVDVEHVHRRRRYREIAAQYFAPLEAAWIEAAGEAEVALRFHRLWVAKEALLKAHGVGIGEALRATRFEARDDGLHAVAGPPAFGDVTRWQVRWCEPAAHYLAAVAIAHPSPSLSLVSDD